MKHRGQAEQQTGGDNLVEVVNAVCAQIDNPEITLDELMTHIKGPDFPTGCTILGTSGIREYMETGHGSVRIRGKAEIVQNGNREPIVITVGHPAYAATMREITASCGARVERTLASSASPLPSAMSTKGRGPSQLMSRSRTVWVASADFGPTTTCCVLASSLTT